MPAEHPGPRAPSSSLSFHHRDSVSAELTLNGARSLLLGTAQGLLAEATRVEQALARFQPTRIALGIPHDDLPTLAEPFDPEDLLPSDATYLTGLARYGPVQLPPPDLLTARDYATKAGLPLHGLDLPEEEYTDVLLQNVRARDLFRDGLRRPTHLNTPDAHAYARAWTAQERETPAYDELHHEREGFMADRLHELLAPGERVLVVLDVAHLDGVLRALHETRYVH